MLQTLTLQNLATIESIEIGFAPGLNALTGETGAGKAVLSGGLDLSLVSPPAAETLRPGARLALAEATFAPPARGAFPRALAALLTGALELDFNPREPLTLRRELSAGGRNRCFANGQMIGVSDLRRIGELLVDLHGQHEHQSLLRAGAAREALDAYAGHEALLDAHAAAWNEAARLRRRAHELEAAAADFARQVDYLDFQLAEFEQVNPQAGEAAELEAEEKRLAHAESLARSAEEAHTLLYEGGEDGQPALLALLREVRKRVAAIAEVDATLAPLAEEMEAQRTALTDAAHTLRNYAERAQADPERLNEVITRREALRKLQRKHGGDEAAVLAAWARLRAEREALAHDDAERQKIGTLLEKAERARAGAADALGQSRRAAAERFAREVRGHLRELKLERARFEVGIELLAEPAAHGADEVDFLLAANPGLPPAPLRKVGSGGELSRVMLALKSVLAARDAIPTLVFDEIDVGLSGEAVRRVAALMEKLAASHQLIAITHHAPIAARAAAHASVRKSARRAATFTEIVPLEGDARLDELARMMGGDLTGQGADAARALARELMA